MWCVVCVCREMRSLEDEGYAQKINCKTIQMHRSLVARLLIDRNLWESR